VASETPEAPAPYPVAMRAVLVFALALGSLAAATPFHPRLFFPPAAMAPLQRRLATDPLAKQLNDSAIKQAGACLSERTVRYEIPDGKRLLYESRKAIRCVLLTAYAWRMTGEARYFERCVREFDAACARKDWNPKHFLDVAEMATAVATAVAIGYDWLYPKLSPEQRGRYETTLVSHALAAAASDAALSASFQGEQALACFRSDWTATALWLGIKGGTPAASHGQMDCGSFVLDWAGSRWFHHLGADDYNLPGYFGGQRSPISACKTSPTTPSTSAACSKPPKPSPARSLPFKPVAQPPPAPSI
jgi:hypothetical protein